MNSEGNLNKSYQCMFSCHLPRMEVVMLKKCTRNNSPVKNKTVIHKWSRLRSVPCHQRKGKERKGKERKVAQLCLTLWDPMDCSLPGSSVHGIFQAIVLEWIAISFSKLRLSVTVLVSPRNGRLNQSIRNHLVSTVRSSA